jgi:ketosteroid isomerase-like protein
MGKAQVVRRFNVPAETLWSYLSWRGMEKLAGGGFFKRVVFEGEGAEVGATKWIHLPEGPPIRERLEWLDAAGYAYGYRVVDSGPLPITDYVGELRITPCGPAACDVVIRNSFVGVTTDDGWGREWETIENSLLDEIEAQLGGAPAPAPEDVAAAIRAASDQFEADFRSGDPERLVANYYVDDPRIAVPDTPLQKGREAAIAVFRGLMDGFSACDLRQVEVSHGGGDIAFELGESTVHPKAAGEAPTRVRYTILWRRTAKGWRVDTDFFAWGALS